MNTRQDTFTSLNVRDHNLSEVLRLIHSHGAMSRAALSRETGLSATTISALVTVLLESGFVREVGEAESSGGRPPILMEFEYEHHYAIGIDLGAAHITAIVIDFRGSPIASVTQEFDAMADASGAITAIRALIRQVVKKAGIDLTQVFGIGVGVPAPLEGEQLDRLSPVILPAWKDIDLRAEMRAEFGDLPIYIDNDANSGALAEKWWGRGREHSNLAYIKLGTGVGSGLIINNDIYRGSAGTAGEIGHTTISPNGPLCRCGNHGCMESYVGTPAILANAASKLKGKSSSALQNKKFTVRDVALGAVQGDPVCVQLVEEAGTYLGIAIANLLNLLNPSLVVLGGDLVAAGDALMNAVRNTAVGNSIPKAGKEAAILPSDLGEDTVAIGAATLVLHFAFHPNYIARFLNA